MENKKERGREKTWVEEKRLNGEEKKRKEAKSKEKRKDEKRKEMNIQEVEYKVFDT